MRQRASLVELLLRMVSYLSGWWRRWLAQNHARHDMRTRREHREQRLEDANTPALLGELHGLLYIAFEASPASPERQDAEDLLDRYTSLLITRQLYIREAVRSRARALGARSERALRERSGLAAEILERRNALWTRHEQDLYVLHGDLSDLESMIRLYCERAIFRLAA